MEFYNEYDNDEEFFENEECTETLQQLRNEIKKSVKKGILDELNQLRKENDELKDVKDRFDAIKAEYDEKKTELEIEKTCAMNRAMKMRLDELTKPLANVVWKVDCFFAYQPKCEKCDRFRNVKIKLPSGRTADDSCPTCGERERHFIVIQEQLFGFAMTYGKMFGKYANQDDKNSYVFVESEKILTFEDFIKDTRRETIKQFYFITRADAQKACDVLNKGIKHPDWIYDGYGEVYYKLNQFNDEADE